VIGEVRGMGLLQGIELVRDRASRAPGDPVASLTQRLINTARAEGLLLYPANGGINDAVLVAPPLTTSPEEIELLLGLLDRALAAVDLG
jgi:4-aminobutyrate aminotransferase-like enzyme